MKINDFGIQNLTLFAFLIIFIVRKTRNLFCSVLYRQVKSLVAPAPDPIGIGPGPNRGLYSPDGLLTASDGSDGPEWSPDGHG
jgi:hypothetical protein